MTLQNEEIYVDEFGTLYKFNLPTGYSFSSKDYGNGVRWYKLPNGTTKEILLEHGIIKRLVDTSFPECEDITANGLEIN